MKLVVFEADDKLINTFKENLKFDDLEIVFVSQPLTVMNVPDYKNADMICVFIYSDVSHDIINQFKNLKFIATRSTGCDHIDCAYAKENGIVVSYVPAYSTTAVAEFTFALILLLIRNPKNFFLNQDGSLKVYNQMELSGNRLGVIGTGRIGKQVIKIARGFNMEVIACDPKEDPLLVEEFHCKYLSLHELLARSDIVSLHVPSTPETYHILDDQTISLMKKGAFLINTARGALVEVRSLVHALVSGHLAGAACDVLEYESFIWHPELLRDQEISSEICQTLLFNQLLIGLANTIVTPHIAYKSAEAVSQMLAITVNNIKAFLVKHPENMVS